jgi:YHS domain-containing protein
MLAGHDVVAYFTRGRHAMGAPQFTSVHEGVTFRFANAEHKALFDGDPKAYLPQYGGFCANGIAYGIPWGGDADSWRIIDGRLYIFGGQGSKDAFELDVPGNLALAEKYWHEEVAGHNSFWQRSKRLLWRVPMLDDIKKTLWATADKLRANMDAAEYKHLVLGLIFVKYISDTFAARRQHGIDPALYRSGRRQTSCTTGRPRTSCRRAGRPRLLQEVNVFWVPESARWESCAPPPSSPTSASASTTRWPWSSRKPQAQGHPRQALRPRPVARRQARRAGRPGLHHRLWRRRQWPATCWARSTNTSSASSPAPKARRAASSTRQPASSSSWSPCWRRTRQGLRPLLRLRRHVRAEREVHRSARRQAGRRVHLRPGIQPHHLAPGRR